MLTTVAGLSVALIVYGLPATVSPARKPFSVPVRAGSKRDLKWKLLLSNVDGFPLNLVGERRAPKQVCHFAPTLFLH